MTTEDEVRALVADRYAAVADESSKVGDVAGLLRSSEKLLEVLDTLPVRPVGGGGAGDGGDQQRGALLSILDGPPTVGDASHG